MHIRILVKREKIEAYPSLLYKLTQLSESAIWTNEFLMLVPSGKYEEITAILESRLICYGIESDMELLFSSQKIEKEKGA